MTFIYVDIASNSPNTHILREGAAHVLCGRKARDAVVVSTTLGRAAVCPHCVNNYRAQGQGFEEIP